MQRMAIVSMQKYGGMWINEVINWQWLLVIASSLVLIAIAPFAKTSNDFFRGSKNEQAPGFWLLTSSLVISWIFAKSITNAANLGLSFGFVGGVAYAAYYQGLRLNQHFPWRPRNYDIAISTNIRTFSILQKKP